MQINHFFVLSDKPVPKQANKLREFIRTISNMSGDNDLDELELTHSQLIDEDVEFDANTCDYFRASCDTDMILLNTK